jgi:hypothetical protein
MDQFRASTEGVTVDARRTPEFEKRSCFRVVYPLRARPKLAIDGQEYEVMDLSEEGVRFSGKQGHRFLVAQELQAVITFHDNDSIVSQATILRADRGEFVLSLQWPISHDRIMKEQRYLINKFAGYL